MWEMPHALQLGLYGAPVAFALVKGDWEERTFAGASLLATLGSLSSALQFHGSYAAGFAVAVFLALRSQKRWPLAAASLALMMLMTEVAQRLVHAGPWAYGAAQGTWRILTDLVLTLGTWRAWRARRPASRQSLTAQAAAGQTTPSDPHRL